jgi:hypothetical protein
VIADAQNDREPARAAWEYTLELLKNIGTNWPGRNHALLGSPSEAERCIALGFPSPGILTSFRNQPTAGFSRKAQP